MKVLGLSQSDIDGGAARAAYRLSTELKNTELEYTLYVMRKLGSDDWVQSPSGKLRQVYSRLLPHFEKWMKKGYKIDASHSWSLNLLPFQGAPKELVSEADVMHFHWLGKNMLTTTWLSTLDKPIVWTLHDTWPLTGGCHTPLSCNKYEQKCGDCPHVKGVKEKDISRLLWGKKYAAYQEKQIHFIAPTLYMADIVAKSDLAKDSPVTVIPNGLDLNTYSPRGVEASKIRLNLPLTKHVILFGAMSANSDHNKGMDLLIEALDVLNSRDRAFSKECVLVVFGSNINLDHHFKLPVISFGTVLDEQLLASLYSAATVTVVPSRRESFGQVVTESLACGTPVVAFNATGPKHLIEHEATGYLAEPFSTIELANGIQWTLSENKSGNTMTQRCREIAEKRFDIRQVVRLHIELYESMRKK
jgi:glycosyltransferase involved in cell wall biosynthesis